MVAVRNAHKSYVRGKSVLRGFNMTVHQATIYAFLGPSGCGKTTLLSCLAGETMLESGEITLGVQYKDEIGYMPQETALTEGLSISELIRFYALLFGINKDCEEKRKAALFPILDVPSEKRIFGTLSGGEQRRISLCIALFHDPQLLILDEPTVGLDPLLNNRVWELLGGLATSKNKTILITTHYIEEARQADRVGMMRDGVLLVEGCPQTIMAEHGCSKLEDVFLDLSVQQQEQIRPFGQISEQIDLGNQMCTVTSQKMSPILNRKFFSLIRVYAHVLMTAVWLLRNILIFLFLLLLPMVVVTLFGFTIGRDPKNLKMGILNKELENGRSIDCKIPYTFNCSVPVHSSCWYMEHLEKKNIILIDFEDEESAMKAAKKNDVWGYIVLWSNYTPSLIDRLEYNLASSDDIVNSSEVAIRIDMSDQYIGNLLKRDILYAFGDFLKEVHKSCGWPLKAARIPIDYEPAIFGSNYPEFSNFGIPSILGLNLFFMPMMYVIGAIVMERQEGILKRNSISGLTYTETWVAIAIVAMLLLVIQSVSMLIVIYIGFELPLKGSIPLILVLTMLCGFCGMCYGFQVAVLCKSENEAFFIGIGSLIPVTLISGMIWPSEAMHKVLQVVSYISPLTLCVDSFRSIGSRGHGITHRTVYPSFFILIIWSIIFLTGAYITMGRKTSRKIITK